ncbi:MAG: alkaline phosphatase family protein [Bacteroidetes bacterium]|nr:alkaline phosphatase family protein [Bacteroidota bacterium]
MRNIIILILLIFPFLLDGQSQITSRPKLIVGIVIDQMRPDYLTRYNNKFGDSGFKRILKSGFYCRNTQFNYAPTYTGPGHASIYTGTTPSLHGITGNDWYDQLAMDTVYCTQDTSVRAVGGEGKEGKEGMMSPHRLLTTTLTDQLRLSTQMKAKVIGISLKDRGAILPAGRSADAAYWYDGKSGNWITSSWYRNDLPKWSHEFNDRKWPEQYLSKPWNTALPIKEYYESDPDDSPYEAAFRGEAKPVFPHDLPALKGIGYDLVRRTPFGNTLTKDFALSAILGEKMGADSIPDFLCVSFSATDYVGHQFGPNAIETEDTYIRLDRDIADLLTFLDNRIGQGAYLLFMTADHACMENPKHMLDHKLAAGFSNPTIIKDTIRYFLKEKYGKPEYLQCYINDQVHLDEALILQDKLSVCTIERELGNFLRKSITGIMDIVTACNLQEEEYNELFRNRIQKGFHTGRSGNVCLLFSPGWTDPLYGGDGTQGTTHGSPYPYDAHVPLLWYGWHIPAGATADEVNITDIAPTLSFLLNITLPNGCTGKKINALVK